MLSRFCQHGAKYYVIWKGSEVTDWLTEEELQSAKIIEEALKRIMRMEVASGKRMRYYSGAGGILSLWKVDQG